MLQPSERQSAAPHPSANGYQSRGAAGESGTVTPPLIPNLQLPVAEVL